MGKLVNLGNLEIPSYFYWDRNLYITTFPTNEYGTIRVVNLTKMRVENLYWKTLVEPTTGDFIEDIKNPNITPTFRLTTGGSPLGIGGPEYILDLVPKI